MDQLIHALKNVLIAEKDAYSGLLGLSERKRDLLINNDVEGISKLIREETSYMKTIRPLSLEREAIIKEISKQKGMIGDIKIDEVISFTNGRLHSELSELKQEFNQVIMKLSRYNELNKRLIDTQLQYTSFCIESLTMQSNIGDTYSSSGQVDERNNKRFALIDQKV